MTTSSRHRMTRNARLCIAGIRSEVDVATLPPLNPNEAYSLARSAGVPRLVDLIEEGVAWQTVADALNGRWQLSGNVKYVGRFEAAHPSQREFRAELRCVCREAA